MTAPAEAAWQEKVADTYIEILPPLVKDAEIDSAQVIASDLMIMGTLDDNYFFGHLPQDVPVRFGRDHFQWMGKDYGQPDDGLFLVVPNPWNPDKVMYIMAANSGMQLFHIDTAKIYKGRPLRVDRLLFVVNYCDLCV